MKIFQIIPGFEFGGAEKMCETLTYELVKKNNEVVVISLYSKITPISTNIENKGIKVYYLNKHLGVDFKIFRKIIELIKKEKPDVIHSHLNTCDYVFLAAFLSNYKGKLIHTIHNVASKDAVGITKIINKFYFSHNLVTPVALSLEIQKSVVEYYKLKKEEVPYVYNGVDLSRCIIKQDYDFGEEIIITHIGRFASQKNHIGLINAFKQLNTIYPNTILYLIGDGELRQEIENKVKEYGLLKNVKFLGNQSNVYPILYSSDIFILPSNYEGIPMTIIEAMGTGLPIIATKVGGVPDMIVNEKEGILVDNNEQSIVNACVDLINNKEKREYLGLNALLKSHLFSAEHMADEYCKIYSYVIKYSNKE